MLTNSDVAEYGRSGGGVLSMMLRSGTDQFRGVLYEFLGNSKMDANDFFGKREGRALPSFKRNQFGGSLTLGGRLSPRELSAQNRLVRFLVR